jgi:two-component system, sensor histidine kinase PdtaS
VAWFPINKKIAINKHIEDFTLPSEATFPLGTIINELLINAKKHAFAGKDTGKINFTPACMERRITLTMQDDGIGLPEGFNISRPIGGLTA